MRHVRSAALTMALMIFLLLMLAEVLRPLLPWLIVLIFFLCIVKLVMRS
jgi:hypothetical protein